MERALFIPPSFAAFAVLTLAFVATVIPQYPAIVENRAPTTKQIAVTQLPTPIPISTKSTATKITRILYSAVKKARAPSAIAPAISFILSVPGSCLFTLAASIAANASAITPRSGTTINIFSIINPPTDLFGKPIVTQTCIINKDFFVEFSIFFVEFLTLWRN